MAGDADGCAFLTVPTSNFGWAECLIGSTHDAVQLIAFQEGATKPIELDAVVEVPLGSFLKRGSTGKVDFISPVPCPFNYGSVPQYLGREGDLLDAVVL